MRKKAERKIREAAALLGDFKVYRLDKIRQKAGLYPKVFDKTILDMARVRTITLKSGNTEGMSSAEVDSLIRRGETLYVYFSFVNAETEHEEREPSAAKPSTINIQLSGLNPE